PMVSARNFFSVFILAGALSAPFAILLAQPKEHGAKYALLIGVKNYDKNELRNLQFTENDMEQLAEVLRDAGYSRVILMTQKAGANEGRLLPLAANIRKTLKGVL